MRVLKRTCCRPFPRWIHTQITFAYVGRYRPGTWFTQSKLPGLAGRPYPGILLNIDARKVFPILTMRPLVVYKEVIRMTIQAEQQICTPHVGRYLLPDEGE